MIRLAKQFAIVLALILCLPMAVFALIAAAFISAIEGLVDISNDDP